MKRENRRVAAMSWGAGDDMPPPKPARVPHAGMKMHSELNTHMKIFVLKMI